MSGEFLIGEFNLENSMASRNRLGQFATGLSGAMQRATSELARYTQNLVVEYYRQTIERPLNSSGNLERVLASPDNKYSSPSGFAVGLVDVMDQEARYWRNIEEGTASAAPGYARTVYGFFRTPGLAPASKSAGGTIQGPISSAQDGRLLEEGSFHPGKFMHRIDIHDIRPHDFFLHAWEKLRAEDTIALTIARHFAEVLDPITGQQTNWIGILSNRGF